MIRFKFIDKIPPVFRNKYLLTIIIFVVWVLLFDSNNLISRYKEMREFISSKMTGNIILNELKLTKEAS